MRVQSYRTIVQHCNTKNLFYSKAKVYIENVNLAQMSADVTQQKYEKCIGHVFT
jgi:hypothetical protein